MPFSSSHNMTTTIWNFAKRTVNYPERKIPTVTSKQWVETNITSRSPREEIARYLTGLFPIFGWITRYNVGWLVGDLIAGITVGIVLVPQSMSYATIATLAPQYGLYSAFVGVFIYCFFATSKDVSIGPVAVMSLTVSQVIKHVDAKHPGEWAPNVIATAVSFICGFIALGVGLLRIGWIVEFIPLPAVGGFMTGSAINIAAGQVPGLMGISGFDTRAATYKVIINTLKGLPNTKLDAAFGLPALVALYAIRIVFGRLSNRYPSKERWFFFVSIMRNGFVIIVLTIASWLSMRHRRNSKGNYPIKILETVPRGFQDVGPPFIGADLLSALASEIPIATVILVMEHIAISKSFGRVNNYKIDPNQELIAIGVTNTVGSVFNAYPATGSFSRSALKAKSGVRTPLAGIFTGIVVIVALYGLTPAFFWIPSAGLSAIIIHAVADLVWKPAQVYNLWRVSPLEFVIWWAAVLVTVFSTIENGIYTAIIASAVLLLVRIARPRGYFLGKVKVTHDGDRLGPREVFLPLNSEGEKAGEITVQPPEPGVVIFRLEESMLYPNASLVNDKLVDHVKEHYRRGKDMSNVSLSDRAWNDPGPRRGHEAEDAAREANKPDLKAIVLDFSAISHIDTTGVQSLVDTRNVIERWTDGPIEFHFASILSPWIKRGLVAGNFGIGRPNTKLPAEVTPVVPAQFGLSEDIKERSPVDDSERGTVDKGYGTTTHEEMSAALSSDDTPFFHYDLASAVRAAELAVRNGSSRVSVDYKQRS